MHDPSITRRRFMGYFSAIGLSGTMFPGVLYALHHGNTKLDDTPITTAVIEQAEKLSGLTFTPEQREMMVQDLNEARAEYQEMQAFPLGNEVSPALVFQPDVRGRLPLDARNTTRITVLPQTVKKPTEETDLAFMSIRELSGLLRRREVTSVELTELYLRRLKQFDPQLLAVVSYTEERAMKAAQRADTDFAAKKYRSLLQGIPWGAKDLLATKGYKTTWGSVPFKDQVLDYDAAVVEKLDTAGAVLLAKLSMGELAWGDVWFGGKTKSPWNTALGASGSSAGVGATVPAGLVGFGIGTETLGSIISPSTRSGVTGFRPTFGRISRYGAMALTWSMDKIGPMCRSAEDCALVFSVLHGRDKRDVVSRDAPFLWPLNPKTLKIGYFNEAFEADYPNKKADQESLEVLKSLGFTLIPTAVPKGFLPGVLTMVIDVESAAAFEGLTRSHAVDKMVRQSKDAWPHVFRVGHLRPAVAYVQANRIRTQLMLAMDDLFQEIDVLVSPSFGREILQITNLTGHPAVCVPNRFDPLKDEPNAPAREAGSISFISGLYKDDQALAVAHAFQTVTDWHKRRPPIGR